MLVEADKFNAKGYYPPRPKDPEACVNCTFCELICPDFAIWSEKPEDEGEAEAATASQEAKTDG